MNDAWKFDLARAAITTILYVTAIWAGGSNSFLYGGGLVGYSPLLLAFFTSPWLAAWISCKLIPSDRRRLVPKLACGIYAGFLMWLLTMGLINASLRNSSVWDPRARFMARHDFALAFVPLCIFLFAGPLVFSRWGSGLRARDRSS